MGPGWNIKFKKSGKGLRTLYPREGNGQRWLMIDLEDKDTLYNDIFRLIEIRRGISKRESKGEDHR